MIMGLFEDAVEEFKAIMVAERVTVSIIYHRGTQSATITTGWISQTAFRTEERGQSNLYWNDRDYCIPVSDLKLNGVRVQPQKGDWIEQVFDNPEATLTFEVSAPIGEQLWRFLDRERKIYLIHTKKMNR
jgi:hypothetical protein